MTSTRLAAAIAADVLVVGILAGAAGSVLFGRTSGPAYGGWGPGYHGMMGSGSWSHDDMLNEMREHMGWPDASPGASDRAARSAARAPDAPSTARGRPHHPRQHPAAGAWPPWAASWWRCWAPAWS